MMGAVIAIFIALTATSFAAVMIRLAQQNGIPSPLIAGGRLIVASLFLTPFILAYYQPVLRQIALRDLLFSMGAGVWIALHFNALSFALEHTTVMVAQVIVNTGPLWVALIETVFLRVRLPRIIYFALMVTLMGGSVIALASTNVAIVGGDVLVQVAGIHALFDFSTGRDPLLGAGLAFLGAIAGSVYMVIGRRSRANVPLIPYVWLLYTTGSVVGMGIVFLTQTPITGYPTMGYVWLLAIAIVPQLIGHSLFNYSLGFFPATIVSITTQSLTITAAVIAFFLFAEVPTWIEIGGSVVIMGGVMMAIVAKR